MLLYKPNVKHGKHLNEESRKSSLNNLKGDTNKWNT